MPKYKGVSSSVVSRLPRYYRFLTELIDTGIDRISSSELSKRMGLTASQIRQDFNCFGGFGQQGYGYNVKQLQSEISNILGLKNQFKTILVGFGNLGKAVVYLDFNKRGFKLCGIFDKDPDIVGEEVLDLSVQDIADIAKFCKEENPIVAVICIPKKQVAEVAKTLIDLGIKFFWNFSHYDLSCEFQDIVVENVHLGDSLTKLCYRTNDLIMDVDE